MTGLFEGQRGNTQAIDKRPREIKQAELKKEEEQREIDMRRQVNEAIQKDMQEELRRVNEVAIKKKVNLGRSG